MAKTKITLTPDIYFENVPKTLNMNIRSELYSTNEFTFAVAVILSAQATDKKVNEVTPALFKIAPTPDKMLKLGLEGLKKHIRVISFFNNKADNIRTSNDVNQVYSTNERRQIIFECHLPDYECRIKDLPDEFFQQLLAEAKMYYKKHHGVYQLTDEDKLEVKSANLDNYNWETKENFAILGYVKAVRHEPEKWGGQLAAQKFAKDKWGTYQKYTEWCDANRKPCLQARAFWRSVSALAELPENFMTVISDTKYDMQGGGRARVFRIDPVGLTEEEKAIANLEDMPL